MTDRELAGCALSDVLALLEKATPGEWAHTPHYGWNITSDTFSPTSRTAGSIGTAIWPHDAAAICAAVNFLRKHGPELLSRAPSRDAAGPQTDIVTLIDAKLAQDALEQDAARYRWLRENDNANMLAEDVIDDAIAAAEGENHG